MTKSNRLLFPREESSYRNMMTRCFNPNATGYDHYGGRGITVCDRWAESFENFYKDMGPRPEGMSLDRYPNPDGDYEPNNCRWATHKEQGLNKSSNHFVEFNGQRKTVQEWADELGMKPNTITYRLRRGWSIEETFLLKERDKPYLSKLSEKEWDKIQTLRDKGYTTLKLSEMFGIDPSQISRKTTNKWRFCL